MADRKILLWLCFSLFALVCCQNLTAPATKNYTIASATPTNDTVNPVKVNVTTKPNLTESDLTTNSINATSTTVVVTTTSKIIS